jgi:hypothetical protein
MAYRNKTYVIFDADTDIHYYRLMQAWKGHDHIDFDFYDAHELNNLRDGSTEETIKRKLRERMNNAKQAIVLVGEKTKNLYTFVRWEIDQAMGMGLPIVVVNLNGARQMDANRCPQILKDKCCVHVSFNAAIIRHALDDFGDNFPKGEYTNKVNLFYSEEIYNRLGL